MKRNIMAITLAIFVIISGYSYAVGPGKTLEFKGNSLGTVIFDGSAHKNAGLTCPDCHNPEMFPKMKQGTVVITMKDMYVGKYCGKCHDGKKAFMIKDNCTRCHHKAGIK